MRNVEERTSNCIRQRKTCDVLFEYMSPSKLRIEKSLLQCSALDYFGFDHSLIQVG